MAYLSRPPGQTGFSRNTQSGLPHFAAYGQAPPAAPHPGAQMRPQRVYKMTLPSDPEEASMVSLRFIHDLVRDGREDPIVRRKAYQIVRAARVRERDYTGLIRAIHHWIQRNIRYEHDPAGVEFLTQARVLIDQVERGEAFEDCDSFVLLEHALLNSLGVPTRSVIIAADARAPQQWSHIFLEAFDNKQKRWVTLDPIMKNKPIGWHPPKFFRKRVVPIADGEPTFPPREGQMGALPQGMTVHWLPNGQDRVPASSMYAGASGIGWHGFSGYGEAPTTPAPTGGKQRIVWELRQANVRPQNMDPVAWVAELEGRTKTNMPPDAVLKAKAAGTPEDVFWSKAILTEAAYWLKTHRHADIASRLEAYREELATSWAATHAAAVAEQPVKVVARLHSELNELLAIRRESLSYVIPILRSVAPLVERAEHHMERIERRQEFLETVNEVAEWTSRALSALGPVTGGITEVLAVAVQLGNMGYQFRQASKLATGSAAAVLSNIANAFERADEQIRAAQEVAEIANTRALAIYDTLQEVEASRPEIAIRAEMQAKQPSIPVPVVVALAAAAGVAALAVLL